MFYHRITATTMLIIAIWVDDGLIAGNNSKTIKEVLMLLNKKFEIEYGPVDHFVGLVISRD